MSAARLPSIDGPMADDLWERADRVLPGGGIYRSRSADMAGRGVLPGFIESGSGCRVTDVDGRRYVDFLCANGPILLGYHHPDVDAAVTAQLAKATSASLYPPALVDFSERLVDRTPEMAWAVAAKNGSDAIALAARVARVATGRSRMMQFESAYHGFAPEFVPAGAGVTPSARSDIASVPWNDVEALGRFADEHEGDLAGVLLNPVEQNPASPVVDATPEFLAAIDELRARTGALLVFDDVRHGLRIHPGGSHVPLGIRPDLICMGKAIGNGQAIAALLGGDALRDAARQLWFTATFCFDAVALTAATTTLEVYDRDDAFAVIERAGERLRTGIVAAAEAAGHAIDYSGPPATPTMVFVDDERLRVGRRFSAEAARRGALLHPMINWFVGAAHDDEAIDETIAIAADAFAATPSVTELADR